MALLSSPRLTLGTPTTRLESAKATSGKLPFELDMVILNTKLYPLALSMHSQLSRPISTMPFEAQLTTSIQFTLTTSLSSPNLKKNITNTSNLSSNTYNKQSYIPIQKSTIFSSPKQTFLVLLLIRTTYAQTLHVFKQLQNSTNIYPKLIKISKFFLDFAIFIDNLSMAL